MSCPSFSGLYIICTTSHVFKVWMCRSILRKSGQAKTRPAQPLAHGHASVDNHTITDCYPLAALPLGAENTELTVENHVWCVCVWIQHVRCRLRYKHTPDHEYTYIHIYISVRFLLGQSDWEKVWKRKMTITMYMYFSQLRAVPATRLCKTSQRAKAKRSSANRKNGVSLLYDEMGPRALCSSLHFLGALGRTWTSNGW